MTLNSGIELHTHSTASDGRDTPQEILQKAQARGIKTLAITDHGTFAGIKQALAIKVAGEDLEIIPGIEYQLGVANEMFHLLAYFPQIPTISTEYHRGLDLNPIKHAYGSLRMRTRPKMLTEEVDYSVRVIKKVRQENGVPVLAHPNDLHLSPQQLSKLVNRLASAGLGGLEVYNRRHPPDKEPKLHEIAEESDLIKTSGTDYHGGQHQLGENKMSQDELLKLKTKLGRG